MEQRLKILTKAEELFLQHGIRSVTMDDIAASLSASKKTLYLYFANKAELLEQVIMQHMQQEMSDLNRINHEAEDAVDEMLTINRHVMQLLRKMNPLVLQDMKKYYTDMWKLLNRQNEQQIYDVVFRNLERGKREGLYRLQLNPAIISRLYVYRSSYLIDEAFFPHDRFSLQELINHVLDYHMHGVLSEEGVKKYNERTAFKI